MDTQLYLKLRLLKDTDGYQLLIEEKEEWTILHKVADFRLACDLYQATLSRIGKMFKPVHVFKGKESFYTLFKANELTFQEYY